MYIRLFGPLPVATFVGFAMAGLIGTAAHYIGVELRGESRLDVPPMTEGRAF